ncbi:MAG: hypothetical protein QHC79_25530 [Pseudosphingobacterium sp.]|nr:hypothetical protein [Pseudosphingobacterium sp.]
MPLEQLSNELKTLVSEYDAGWFLGDLSGMMKLIPQSRKVDQLSRLSSPLRQLYYLGGLVISTSKDGGNVNYHEPEVWEKVVDLLNRIEWEYARIFFPKEGEEPDDDWHRVREVAMPSFLDYFNQGPLNYEEQTINWIEALYSSLDDTIERETGLRTADFLKFYENVDRLMNENIAFIANEGKLRPNWRDYTRVTLLNEAPAALKFMVTEAMEASFHFTADHGMSKRFYPKELECEDMTAEKINRILGLFSCRRQERDFLYYTATRPGNPLLEFPIFDLEDGLFQIFETKQVLHAIEMLLEKVCSKNASDRDKIIDRKGSLLEKKIEETFTLLFGNSIKIFKSYYIDGCEQDILIIWNDYAFIIEAKGYNLREPMRDPDKAFLRIKNDFKSCVGYGYDQCLRVERKFVNGIPLEIRDHRGNLIETIDTAAFEDNVFCIVVNLKTFGQVQTDLSTLLEVPQDSSYPWVVKLDDLETFFLTMKTKGKGPKSFIDFLHMRETLHEKLICSDELQICGGFIQGLLPQKSIDEAEKIVTKPDMADIFDDQYRKGMGFHNEKHWEEKKGGKHFFW